MPTRPNVLVFFTDQQRWDTVGCYGNPMNLTPNLDALARRGAQFEHAFTCQPVCGPARASLQTGLYATAAGVWHNDMLLAENLPTLADGFNAGGYDTGYIGKWHLFNNAAGPVPKQHRGRYRHWVASNVLEFTSHPNDGVIYDADNRPIRMNGYRVDRMTDLAIDFISQPRQGPFFLCLSYLEPHFQNDMQRFVAPDGYAARYQNPYVPLDLAGHEGDWPRELPDYYGMCASLDENLGRLLGELSRRGQLENTIVCFVTDHGCHFRTRNDEYKRSCHESSIHIPLVLAGPGLAGGKKIPQLVSLVDLPPTLLSAAGLPLPGPMHGRDLMPLVNGQAKDWLNEVFIQISESQVGRAIRTDRWKYSALAPGRRGWQDGGSDLYVDDFLYDLAADPWEQTNLIASPQHHEILAHLRQRLIARMVAAGESAPKIGPRA